MRDETYIQHTDWNTNAEFKHNFLHPQSEMFSNLSPALTRESCEGK